MSERDALLALAMVPGIGPTTLLKLQSEYQTYNHALQIPISSWPIRQSLQQSAASFLRDFSVPKFLRQLEQLNQSLVTWLDSDYPSHLLNISTPPPILFYQGSLACLKSKGIAVVGTRHPTTFAPKVVSHLLTPLCENKLVIISGFQKGIDQLAHRVACTNRTPTIAVLGTGIDVPYPPGSDQLKQAILKTNGLFLSEFPPGTHAEKGNFPRRNRIVSGLSDAVIIIEAALRSGSLVTAQHALEQGKELFAVPGSILAKASEGTNYLLKQGAKPITSAHDLISEIATTTVFSTQTAPTGMHFSGWQQELYQYIIENSPTLDECIEKIQRPTTDILMALTQMEVATVIRKNDLGCYEMI